MNYLVYHPEREVSEIGDLCVYHDSFNGNQDPYIWNEEFLHSFCHMTQLTTKINEIVFWVSGDSFPNFTKLKCDCVFVIKQKIQWGTPNFIDRKNSMVESDNAFEHHYKWVNKPHCEHIFTKRTRYTLKADKERSFQPQDKNKNLIDILPFLIKQGISIDTLINGIGKTVNGKRTINSKPFKLSNEISKKIYEYLSETSAIKIYGKMIVNKYPNITLKPSP